MQLDLEAANSRPPWFPASRAAFLSDRPESAAKHVHAHLAHGQRVNGAYTNTRAPSSISRATSPLAVRLLTRRSTSSFAYVYAATSAGLPSLRCSAPRCNWPSHGSSCQSLESVQAISPPAPPSANIHVHPPRFLAPAPVLPFCLCIPASCRRGPVDFLLNALFVASIRLT